MRKPALLFAVAAFAGAAAASALVAQLAVRGLETRLSDTISATLADGQAQWASYAVDGAQVTLGGTAPTESARIDALRRVAVHVPANRLTDGTRVEGEVAGAPATPAELRILRDAGSLRLLGVVPATLPLDDLLSDTPGLSDLEVSDDLLLRPDSAVPTGWEAELAYALEAATRFQAATLRLVPGRLVITGTAPTAEDAALLASAIFNGGPDGLQTVVEVGAPRPVISPYLLRAEQSDTGTVLTDCTAQTDADRTRILDVSGQSDPELCRIGLGAPDEAWADVVTSALELLDQVGGGTLDMRDGDIQVTGSATADPVKFEAAISGFRDQLPPMYRLTAALPPRPEPAPPVAELAPPRFKALRTEDGAVRMRGDMGDAAMQAATTSFAQAQFGFNTVLDETKLREGLPTGWSVHVLAGLQALALLRHGQLEISETAISLIGTTGTSRVEPEIRAMLGARLPASMSIDTEIWVEEELAALVAPRATQTAVPFDLCAEQIDILLDGAQILFPPSQTDISEESFPIIDEIAQVLRQCPGARFEIGGHTDSQGRESSNMALSQARADSVLSAVLERGIDTVFLYSRGYGESKPIADNETDEGRARNRRIEFRLIEEGGASSEPPDVIEGAQVAPTAPTPPAEEVAVAALEVIPAAIGQQATSGAVPAALRVDTAPGQAPVPPDPAAPVPSLTATDPVAPPQLAALETSQPPVPAIPPIWMAPTVVDPLPLPGRDAQAGVPEVDPPPPPPAQPVPAGAIRPADIQPPETATAEETAEDPLPPARADEAIAPEAAVAAIEDPAPVDEAEPSPTPKAPPATAPTPELTADPPTEPQAAPDTADIESAATQQDDDPAVRPRVAPRRSFDLPQIGKPSTNGPRIRPRSFITSGSGN